METPYMEPQPPKNDDKGFLGYLRSLMNISDDTDSATTIDNIKQGAEFRGINVWLLIFAILLASVGLNVNSTAVIIGAMLVSPLMGPIMGLGLSVGISDNELLKTSLKNLFTMVVISLLTSSVYFFITPLSDAQSELLARTNPTIFDVMIAFVGGLAGIVASSRKQEKTTVVAGVAIATALMPPLCTAGYGVGTGQWNYFIGAFYLFFINSFFIASATFIMVRYLKFPHRNYVDKRKSRRIRFSLAFFTLLVAVPSVILAINMVKEATFNSNVNAFVSNLEKDSMMENVQIVNVKKFYTRNGQSLSLLLVGKELSQEEVALMQSHLPDYHLEGTHFTVRQSGGTVDFDLGLQAQLLQGLIEKKEAQLEQADSLIMVLQAKLNERDGVNVATVSKEMALLWPEVTNVSFADASVFNVKTDSQDTITQVRVDWRSPVQKCDTTGMAAWLRLRLNNGRPLQLDHHFSR
ncbi:MAG: DUF389 domain-containing protein [Paludibacteraceae bacterium]|nr:DUF389 domain-containing protein [Paludibacteraceae bacterium]